jgi:hypothetical protein
VADIYPDKGSFLFEFFDLRHSLVARQAIEPFGIQSEFAPPGASALLVDGIAPMQSTLKLQQTFGAFGDVRSLVKLDDVATSVLVEYYDIRDALFARDNLSLKPQTACEFCSGVKEAIGLLTRWRHQEQFREPPGLSKVTEEPPVSLDQIEQMSELKLLSDEPNELNLFKIASGADERTTFMIRNIPNKYTQQMLIDMINETHQGAYDFMYLRMDFKNKCNVGYAFINFIDPLSVISFALRVSGKKWAMFNSDKVCEVRYATIQGKEALVQKFKDSCVMLEEESYRPKIFYSSGERKGQEEPFPVGGRVRKEKSKHLYSPRKK